MCYKKLFTHAESHVNAVSLLESGEECYVKVINNNNSNCTVPCDLVVTVAVQCYCQVLSKKNTGAASPRQCPLCMSAVDRTTIHNFGFTFIDHPLYPQDLAPWDFHPFSNLTKPVAGAHLTTTNVYSQDLAPWDFHLFSNLTKPQAGAHLTTTNVYSQDLAPPDFHLFSNLTKPVAGAHLTTTNVYSQDLAPTDFHLFSYLSPWLEHIWPLPMCIPKIWHHQTSICSLT